MSTRAGTIVQVVSCPSSVGGSFRWPGGALARSLARRRPIEQSESLFDGQAFSRRERSLDTDSTTRDQEVELVAGGDAEFIGHPFGNRYLKLARDLGHVLTLARIHSLVNSRRMARE